MLARGLMFTDRKGLNANLLLKIFTGTLDQQTAEKQQNELNVALVRAVVASDAMLARTLIAQGANVYANTSCYKVRFTDSTNIEHVFVVADGVELDNLKKQNIQIISAVPHKNDKVLFSWAVQSGERMAWCLMFAGIRLPKVKNSPSNDLASVRIENLSMIRSSDYWLGWQFRKFFFNIDSKTNQLSPPTDSILYRVVLARYQGSRKNSSPNEKKLYDAIDHILMWAFTCSIVGQVALAMANNNAVLAEEFVALVFPRLIDPIHCNQEYKAFLRTTLKINQSLDSATIKDKKSGLVWRKSLTLFANKNRPFQTKHPESCSVNAISLGSVGV